MNITATETHRMGASVHLQFTDDDGKDIYPGGRYVKAEDWDADPEKVTAEVAEYLATLPVAAISTAPVKSPCAMTNAQVTAKLEAIQAEKDAAEAARLQAIADEQAAKEAAAKAAEEEPVP